MYLVTIIKFKAFFVVRRLKFYKSLRSVTEHLPKTGASTDFGSACLLVLLTVVHHNCCIYVNIIVLCAYNAYLFLEFCYI